MLLEVANGADVIFELSNVWRVLLLWGRVHIPWHVVGLSHVSFLLKFLLDLHVIAFFAFFALSAFSTIFYFNDTIYNNNFGFVFLETLGDGLGLDAELVSEAGLVVDLGLFPLVLGVVGGRSVLVKVNLGPGVVHYVLPLVRHDHTVISAVQEVVVLVSLLLVSVRSLVASVLILGTVRDVSVAHSSSIASLTSFASFTNFTSLVGILSLVVFSFASAVTRHTTQVLSGDGVTGLNHSSFVHEVAIFSPSITKLVKLQLKGWLFLDDRHYFYNTIDNDSVGTSTSTRDGPSFLLGFSGVWVDVVRSHEFGLLELIPILVLEALLEIVAVLSKAAILG